MHLPSITKRAAITLGAGALTVGAFATIVFATRSDDDESKPLIWTTWPTPLEGITLSALEEPNTGLLGPTSGYQPAISADSALRIANKAGGFDYDRKPDVHARQIVLAGTSSKGNPNIGLAGASHVWIVNFDPSDPNIFMPAPPMPGPASAGVDYLIVFVDADTGEVVRQMARGLPPEPGVLATWLATYTPDVPGTPDTPAPAGISPEPTETPARGVR